jgi:hypothetical protein
MSNALAFDWDAPISDHERDALLERIATAVRSRGLQTPAVWFLEVHKPLAPLGSQFGIAFSPFLGIFFGGGAFDLQKYTKLMQSTGNVDRLIRLIDGDVAPNAQPAIPAAKGAEP